MPHAQPIAGIPDKSQYGDISQLTPGQLIRFIIQRHEAERAGPHMDMRFGTPETGLFSWATRHPMPVPGQKRMWIQQPVHSYEYGDFQGNIPEGYGKGKVKKVDDGELLVTKVSPNSIHFTVAHKKHPERFVMMRKGDKDKNWLIINNTPTEPLPFDKPHFAEIPAEKAEAVLSNLQPGASAQAKVDGAHSLIKLYKDRVEVLSYRRQKETGRPILHTERMLHGLPRADIPKEHVGSVLRGELYGTREGRTVPVQQLGGLLNASVANSIRSQRRSGIQLKNMLFDVARMGKKPAASTPYMTRMDLLRGIQKYLPGKPGQWHLPDQANTPEDAKALMKRITEQKHPLSSEGLVIHPPVGTPKKMKLFDEYDVHIRNIFPGEGKYTSSAGGFDYSFTPDGPISGRVGTGLSDELRNLMMQAPDDYIGRVARVRAQERLPSGALRVPSLLALHEDYPSAEIAPLKHTPPIKLLLQAKAESDRKNYMEKNRLLRGLMLDNPTDFVVDSSEGKFYGITHKPTGFQVHLPRDVIPENIAHLPITPGAIAQPV